MMTEAPPPNELFGGRYEVGERIGAGGMAVVHAGTQVALRRPVAIKVLRRAFLANPRVVAHFRREALITARLNHCNLIAVFDAGDMDDGRPFIVMEHAAGESLGTLVRERVFEVPRAGRIAGHVLAALGEAHRRGVIHADVKSDNVLVHTAHDGTDRVKLIDFGLAHLHRDAPTTDEYGRPAVAGTPEFMAPEVVRGGEPSVASDVYAVGTMLYELLTGATPFAGGSHADVMRRQLEDAVVPPSLRRPAGGIPAALDDAVMRALAKHPDERFADVDALARAIGDAISGLRDEPIIDARWALTRDSDRTSTVIEALAAT